MNVQSTAIADGLINTNLSIPRNPRDQLYEQWPNLNYFHYRFGRGLFLGADVLSVPFMNLIRVGAGQGQRIGPQAQVKAVNVSLRAIGLSNAASPGLMRIVLFKAAWPGTTSDPPGYSDIFLNPDVQIWSTYHPDKVTRDRNTVIYDSGQIALDAVTTTTEVGTATNTFKYDYKGTATQYWSRELFIPIEFTTFYKGDTGNTDDVASNNIWALVFTDAQNPLFISFSGFMTIYYLP